MQIGYTMANDPTFIPTTDFTLPESSTKRLGATGVATTDLSTSEVLLTRAAGFTPLRFVMGVSVFHMPSWTWTSNKIGNCEFKQISQAIYAVRESAMLRMEAEADVVGADGVVGVRFGWHVTDHGSEFHAYGTAVKADPKKHEGRTWRNNRNMPFLSDLSGQNFYTCIKSGYAPVGFVLGCCVYHMGYRTMSQSWKQRNSISEIPLYTQAMYDARELAMARMEAEANALEADMVLEFKITQHGYGWNHVVEFLSSGTAVKQFEADPDIDPALVLNLAG